MADYPQLRHKIEFSESNLDSFGKVSIAAICDQIQIAATDHANILGVGMVDLQKKGGVTWMLAKMTLCFDRWPETHTVTDLLTWPSATRGRLVCVRDYDVRDSEGRQLIRGTSDWVVVDVVQRKIVRLSPELLTLAPEGAPRAEIAPAEKKPKAPEGEKFECEIRVRRSDIDINCHVNNVHYIEWLFEPLPCEVLTRRLLRFDIEFHDEALHGETVISEAVLMADGKTVHTLHKEDGTLLTTAVCTWAQQ